MNIFITIEEPKNTVYVTDVAGVTVYSRERKE